MRILKKLLILSILFVFNSCDKNDTPEITSGTLAIHFNHDWNEYPIDFNELKYTNTYGNLIRISKIRYLISNIILHKSDGNNINLEGYILVDLNKENLTMYASNVPFDNYSSISFTFGFNETDNIDGAYNDLNSESWNWPQMLGGGYHFMQFEGKYKDTGTENPFAYHMGTAKKSEGIFEQNFFNVELNGFTFSNESTLNIHMNVAEWFTNPNTWNLNEYSINLMPNYDAQKMMNENGKSVFRLGEINE